MAAHSNRACVLILVTIACHGQFVPPGALYVGHRRQSVPMRALTPKCLIFNSILMNPGENLSSWSRCQASAFGLSRHCQSSIAIARWTSRWRLRSSHFGLNTTSRSPRLLSQWALQTRRWSVNGKKGINVPSGIRKTTTGRTTRRETLEATPRGSFRGRWYTATLAAGGPQVPSCLARGQASPNGW